VNTFKKADEKPKEKKSENKISKSLLGLFSGDFLSQENIVSRLPYIFFLTFLGILYISNGYYAEKTVTEWYQVGNELKELHSEYITTKSDLNFKSKQSQVAEAVVEQGVKESIIPPTKILVDDEEFKKISEAR